MQPLWLLVLLPFSTASIQHDDDQFDVIDMNRQQFHGDIKEDYSHCFSNTRKSPIDIDLATVRSVTLPPLVFTDYSASENVSENFESNFTETVHGYTNWTKKPILSGGPLNGEYHLMTVQWDGLDLMPASVFGTTGPFFKYGHNVNGGRHDFELHFVHTKNGISIEEAKLVPEGIVIVAVFIAHLFEITNDTKLITTPVLSDAFAGRNVSTEKLDELHFMNYTLRENKTAFKWLNPEAFLPDERDSYFVYKGTFTHPPCTDDVTWIILTHSSYLDFQHQQIFSSAANNAVSLRYHSQFLKNRKNSKVLLNIPNSSDTISSSNVSNKAGNYLGMLAMFICGVAVGLLGFYMGKKFIKNSVEDGKDRHPVVNYQIGFDNINVS